MDRLLEIGEIGILRDIPAELTQLQSANKVLKFQLSRQTNIANILKVCLFAAIVYIAIKAPPFKQKDE